jgi:hypothetical protein
MMTAHLPRLPLDSDPFAPGEHVGPLGPTPTEIRAWERAEPVCRECRDTGAVVHAEGRYARVESGVTQRFDFCSCVSGDELADHYADVAR